MSPAQVGQVKTLSGGFDPSALVVRYTVSCGGKVTAHAYTDTHRVRTHDETLFIAVDLQGSVEKVEVLSFDEPLDYIPKVQWYGTFKGSPLDSELQIRGRIPFVTGASLTGKATLQSVRMILATDRVLREEESAVVKSSSPR